MSEWIKWYGGNCPVHADARVAIKTRIDEQFEQEDGEPVPDREGKAGRFYWRHAAEHEDIVAYRVLSPEAPASSKEEGE